MNLANETSLCQGEMNLANETSPRQVIVFKK